MWGHFISQDQMWKQNQQLTLLYLTPECGRGDGAVLAMSGFLSFFCWQILEWQLSTWKPYRVLWRSTKNLWRCPGFYWWINFGDGSDLYSWLEVLSNRNNMWLNHTACVFLSNLWQVVEISWSLALKNPVILGPFFMLDYWESFACPDWENRRFVPQPTKWYIVKL